MNKHNKNVQDMSTGNKILLREIKETSMMRKIGINEGKCQTHGLEGSCEHGDFLQIDL
jgi:hypothetical protein